VLWSRGPLEPFLAVKLLAVGLGAAALLVWRAEELTDWVRTLRRNPADAVAAALAVWAVLSAVAAERPEQAARALLAALPFALVFVCLRVSPASQSAALGATLAAALVNCAAGAAQWLDLPLARFGLGEEPIGLLGNRNHLAAFLAVSFPLFFLPSGDPPRSRDGNPGALPASKGRLAGALVAAAVLAMTGCRGAILAVTVSLAVVLVGRRSSGSQKFVIALACSAGLLVTAWASLSTSGRARGLAWTMTASGVLRHPVLGHGPGSFANAFAALQQERFGGLERDPERLSDGAWRLTRNHREAHNDWLQSSFELGIPGAALLLILLGVAMAAPGRPQAMRASAVALVLMGCTSFPMQTPATALLAMAVLAAALPAWHGPASAPRSSGAAMAAWAVVAALALLLTVHCARAYMALAAHGTGLRLLSQGRLAEAEAAFREALAGAPGDGRIRAALGRALEARGQPAEALRAFEDAARDRLDSSVLANQAVVLRQLGRKPEALIRFRAAVATLPTDSEAWYLLGLALDETGAGAEALSALDRACELSVENFKAYLDRARLTLRLGRAADATRLFADNAAVLVSRMAAEDPSLRTVDPAKREFLVLTARELLKLYQAAGASERQADLERTVARFFPAGSPSPLLSR
jgi:tetratricopeptide (TPR) repeat protein